MELQGVYTALVTPFTEDDSAVDLSRLQQQIVHQAEGGVAGVVPSGTTGESPTLSQSEWQQVIETTVRTAHQNGLTVIAGTGSNNTSHAVSQHLFAHQAGADASLQVIPYYNKPSQEGMYRHFMTLADSCELPIVLYNIPGRAGASLSQETIRRLAHHPQIQAIKDATGGLEFLHDTVLYTDLTVLSGDDPLTFPMLTVGARGVVSVVSNILPDQVTAMCRACSDGDWETARAIHYHLYPLARDLLTLDSNPVPVKSALHLLGRDSGAVRPPLCKPSDEVIERLKKRLDTILNDSASEISSA